MGFHHIFSKSIGFNPLSTGVGKQGAVVIQVVEGSYSVVTYQHRLGNTIIGATTGLAGNIVAGLIISRGNTGGISASNNYDSHISLHANNTANAIAKIIASIDSTGVPRTQFASSRFGVVGPVPGATGSTGFLSGAWNSESYTPKVPFHVIQDSANLNTINGSGGGINGLTLPINLLGLRVLSMNDVINARGGGLIQGLTPAYNITSFVSGATVVYGFDDIVLRTFARGATNPSPNIWINPGGTGVNGGAVVVGLNFPTGNSTLAGSTGQYIRSKMAIGGPVTIGSSIDIHRDAVAPTDGIRIQGAIYQGHVKNYPGASASYNLFGYYGGTGSFGNEGILTVGDEIWNRDANAQIQYNQNNGVGGIPSNFAAAFGGSVVIRGKYAAGVPLSGNLQKITTKGPTAVDASLMVGGYSIFGDDAYAQSWYLKGPWYTGGMVSKVGVFGDPITGYSSPGFDPLGFPDSAVLSANSTTKGFAPPRMTATQRIGISNPTVGLMVYQLTGGTSTATEGLWVYQSTGWTGPLR
jgi:hypothetical protein